MDITCATCREPWDSYHMRHDAIWEVWDGGEGSESHELCKGFLADPRRSLTPPVRAALEDDGWKFGATIFTILRCPCCDANEDHNGTPNAEKVAHRKEAYLMLEESLGDDHDGLISTLNDFDYVGAFDRLGDE